MNFGIIAAAGVGKRMNKGINKAFLEMNNKPILYYSLNLFENSSLVDKVVVVVKEDEIEKTKKIVEHYGFKKVKWVIAGGKLRQDSVHNAITLLKPYANPDDLVIVHNGCNIFVSEEELIAVIREAKKAGAAILAQPVRDTLKVVKDGIVKRTLDRTDVWQAQTPQAMLFSTALEAFGKARSDNYYATDDSALVERLGKEVRVIASSYKNFKITTPEDLEIAKSLLNSALVGYGEDSHRFLELSDETNKQGAIVLGGVKIPYKKSLEAFSDGDVVLHALFNAISSALGGRSIGYYFPNSDTANKNRDSKEFFAVIHEMLEKNGFKVNNVAVSVEAKEPRLEGYVEQMKESIAELLSIKASNVGITITSGEGLSDFGKGLGIRASCYVSLTTA